MQCKRLPRPFALVVSTSQPAMRSGRTGNAFVQARGTKCTRAERTRAGKFRLLEQQSSLCVFIPTGNSTGARHALPVLGRAAVRPHGHLVGHVRAAPRYERMT